MPCQEGDDETYDKTKTLFERGGESEEVDPSFPQPLRQRAAANAVLQFNLQNDEWWLYSTTSSSYGYSLLLFSIRERGRERLYS